MSRKVFADNSRPSTATTMLINFISHLERNDEIEKGNDTWNNLKIHILKTIDEFDSTCAAINQIVMPPRVVVNKHGTKRHLNPLSKKEAYKEYLKRHANLKSELGVGTLLGEGNLLLDFNNFTEIQHIDSFTEIFSGKITAPKLPKHLTYFNSTHNTYMVRNSLCWLFGYFHFVAPRVSDKLNIVMMQRTVEVLLEAKNLINYLDKKGPFLKPTTSFDEKGEKIKEAYHVLTGAGKLDVLTDPTESIECGINEWLKEKYGNNLKGFIRKDKDGTKHEGYTRQDIIDYLERFGYYKPRRNY